MEIVNKREINFSEDIGLNTDGKPMELVYIDFEPVPLLPTYSFINNGEELRYALKKNPSTATALDRLNCFILQLI